MSSPNPSSLAAAAFPELAHILTSLPQSIQAAVESVERIPAGYLNRQFVLRSAGRDYVLKIYSESPVSPRLSPSRRASAEYEALAICQAYGLNAPIPIALLGDAVLMTKVPGVRVVEVFDDACLERIVRWLAHFHNIPPSTAHANIGLPNTAYTAATVRLRLHMQANPGDSFAFATNELLSSAAAPPDPSRLSRGDPTLGNWLLHDTMLFGVDFEFFSLAHPVFDVGLLLASLLDHTRFTADGFRMCRTVLSTYNGPLTLQPQELRLALLCGLVLIAVSVPDPFRRHLAFRSAPDAVSFIETL